MKKIFVLCLVAWSTMSFAQKEIAWFDTGLKIMYGQSAILNSAIFDHDELNYDLGFGNSYSIGGKFGINRAYNGLAIELMYAKGGSDLEYLNHNYRPAINWSALDLYLLFRNAKNLGFFELGPKISFVRGVQRTNGDGELVDFTRFNNKLLSGVLSFGVNVLGTDGAFSGQIGLRFEYGFSDLVDAEDGTTEPYPFATDVYADGYQKSVPVYAGLVFELNWGLGFYGIAQCGARAKFFKM